MSPTTLSFNPSIWRCPPSSIVAFIRLLNHCHGITENSSTTSTLWARIAQNPDCSTGPLARPFACSLAPLIIHLLRTAHFARALRCTHLFAQFTHTLARRTVNDWMAIFSVFCLFWIIVQHQHGPQPRHHRPFVKDHSSITPPFVFLLHSFLYASRLMLLISSFPFPRFLSVRFFPLYFSFFFFLFASIHYVFCH